ncbi:MAG: DegT/DnrJ/EryC1/StrS family aminotransferase [Flavobacteriaceae bacterium]|nr:DegT/DnrJ/EryC1/StrS family aminotransferase [Flavobacteriaceae bacterium]
MNTTTKDQIPFYSLDKMNSDIRSEILDSFESFFDSKSYILGSSLNSFEIAYSSFSNSKFCVGISNGLDALTLSIKALNIGKGDEILVPSNTFIGSVLAITNSGATPIFIEPDIETYNIDTKLIEHKITSKTKAIMPVHLYGQPCNMTEVLLIAKKYNINIIEDNSQSQGAKWDNMITGSMGTINAVSFYPGKNLGAFGDGGAITTNDSKLNSKILAMRNYGSVQKYEHEIVGFNNRLDECQAGFLEIKLNYLKLWNQERNNIAKLYMQCLNGVGDIILPKIHPNAYSVFHIYNIRTNHRNDLQIFLKENGVGTLVHYPKAIHLQKCYSYLGYVKGDFPIAEEICATSLSLPIWPGMTDKKIKYICSKIKEFYNKI